MTERLELGLGGALAPVDRDLAEEGRAQAPEMDGR
jgi:hypothetical protein